MAMIANTVSVTNLFNESNIYVIPSFQRPYAWEKNQWDELIEDIRNATHRKSPYHYFAPIHVVQINDPGADLWKRYTDKENEDIADLGASGFRGEFGNLNVFLVIDGQQRLITFYSLLNQYFKRFATLSGSIKIPSVVLNSWSDQIVFRNLLGLGLPHKSVSHVSRAQLRLKCLFDKLNNITLSDPCFSTRNLCHDFITGSKCETLLVQLDPTARLSAFMTLNDRGKRLTNLEKTKSLFMEIDDNHSNPNPYKVNSAFGNVYQSLEAKDAYVDDDEFLKQIGMALWEGGNLAIISGANWPISAPGKNRNNSVHQIGSDFLYENYFKKIPASIAGNFLHNEIILAIDAITSSHDHLVKMVGQAETGLPLHFKSFAQSMGFGTRDAIEDYHAVLLSLGLQGKQIGFLLAIRKLFPDLEWHDDLGGCQIDNRSIKKELVARLAVIKQENQNISGIDQIVDLVDHEINNVPDIADRKYTALQIAEALRLIVGNSKPGGFSGTWDNTFRSSTLPSHQSFMDQWIYYIASYGSRNNFIVWNIGRSTDAYNSNAWVKYFLKEYDFCLCSRNAHRRKSSLEIEHFFPSSWEGESYFSDITRHGFTSCEQYKQSFVDQIGNKLVLDKALNASIKDQDPSLRVSTYRTQAYGSVNVMGTNPSESAIQIGNDLSGVTNPHQYRLYVQLRSLRLAAFAARRF